MTLHIRIATLADADTIARFNNSIAEETENKTLDPAVLDSGVKKLLADNSKGRYWVAEKDARIVGQIMVTYEWSDWRDGLLWWIQSVYVHADYRRQGVFRALYAHVKSLAQQADDIRGIRLYVEKDNVRAQTTYKALGMIEPGYQVMEEMFPD